MEIMLSKACQFETGYKELVHFQDHQDAKIYLCLTYTNNLSMAKAFGSGLNYDALRQRQILNLGHRG